METDFLVSGNYFFPFLRCPSGESYFLSSGNALLNKSSNPNGGDAFSALWKPFHFINLFFQQVETVTEIIGNPLFWSNHFIPTSKKRFSVS